MWFPVLCFLTCVWAQELNLRLFFFQFIKTLWLLCGYIKTRNTFWTCFKILYLICDKKLFEYTHTFQFSFIISLTIPNNSLSKLHLCIIGLYMIICSTYLFLYILITSNYENKYMLLSLPNIDIPPNFSLKRINEQFIKVLLDIYIWTHVCRQRASITPCEFKYSCCT